MSIRQIFNENEIYDTIPAATWNNVAAGGGGGGGITSVTNSDGDISCVTTGTNVVVNLNPTINVTTANIATVAATTVNTTNVTTTTLSFDGAPFPLLSTAEPNYVLSYVNPTTLSWVPPGTAPASGVELIVAGVNIQVNNADQQQPIVALAPILTQITSIDVGDVIADTLSLGTINVPVPSAVAIGDVLAVESLSPVVLSWVPQSGGGGGSGTVESVGATSPNLSVTGTATINPTINLNPVLTGITSLDVTSVTADDLSIGGVAIPTAQGATLGYVLKVAQVTPTTTLAWQADGGSGSSGTVTSVTGSSNISITGTPTVAPTVELNTSLAGLTSVSTNSLTINSLPFPAIGTANQVLSVSGAGQMEWQTLGSGGAVDAVTAGTNCNITGTISNPIVNVNANMNSLTSVATTNATVTSQLIAGGGTMYPLACGTIGEVLAVTGTNQLGYVPAGMSDLSMSNFDQATLPIQVTNVSPDVVTLGLDLTFFSSNSTITLVMSGEIDSMPQYNVAMNYSVLGGQVFGTIRCADSTYGIQNAGVTQSLISGALPSDIIPRVSSGVVLQTSTNIMTGMIMIGSAPRVPAAIIGGSSFQLGLYLVRTNADAYLVMTCIDPTDNHAFGFATTTSTSGWCPYNASSGATGDYANVNFSYNLN